MNKMERDLRPEGPAELEFLDGEYSVVKAGSYVVAPSAACTFRWRRCAIGASISRKPTHATIALQRFRETGKTP